MCRNSSGPALLLAFLFFFFFWGRRLLSPPRSPAEEKLKEATGATQGFSPPPPLKTLNPIRF